MERQECDCIPEEVSVCEILENSTPPMAIEIRGLNSEKGLLPLQLVEVLPPYVWMSSRVPRPFATPDEWQVDRILIK
jgi:hypothetical protein